MAGQAAAAESFWRFSLMLYARPGVAGALLRLQDAHGHNVNLILFALWLGFCEGAALDRAGLARAGAAIAALDGDVVRPLRRLRRHLKDIAEADIGGLRRRILALELAAERRVQARLAALALPPCAEADRRALADANLRQVLGPDHESAEAAILRHAALPKAEPEDRPL